MSGTSAGSPVGDGSTRFASRVLLFDRLGRTLLFLTSFEDTPDQARWITPGGGAMPGETPHETAVRELFEETGLAVADLGEVVHTLEFPVNRPNARHSFAHWTFYRHVVDEAFAPSSANWTPEEHVDVKAWRWWDVEELVRSGELFSPLDLPDLARRLGPAA